MRFTRGTEPIDGEEGFRPTDRNQDEQQTMTSQERLQIQAEAARWMQEERGRIAAQAQAAAHAFDVKQSHDEAFTIDGPGDRLRVVFEEPK